MEKVFKVHRSHSIGGHSLQILWLGATAGTTSLNLDSRCTEAFFRPFGMPSGGRLPTPQDVAREESGFNFLREGRSPSKGRGSLFPKVPVPSDHEFLSPDHKS